MSEPTGPGTAAYRLNWLLEELERRFPNPEPFRSDIGPEEHYLAAIDNAHVRHIREAVEAMPFMAEPEADFVAVEWVSERGNRHRVTMPRAALLDALTKGNE